MVDKRTPDLPSSLVCKYSRSGADLGGEAPGAPPPPKKKLEKIWFFGVKSWFFTRNTPKIFAPPSARRNFFKYAPPPPLTWNPGSAPNNYLFWNVFIIIVYEPWRYHIWYVISELDVYTAWAFLYFNWYLYQMYSV